MGSVSATELFDPPSDDPVPVDRKMVAAAYWDGRESTPTADAQGLLSLLNGLAAIDASMADWNMVGDEGETVQLTGDADALAEQMAARTAAAEIAPGVAVTLACPGTALMTVRAGIPSGTDPRFGTNGVSFWPGSPSVRPFWLTASSLLLTTLVETFGS